jgi:serine protease Do
MVLASCGSATEATTTTVAESPDTTVAVTETTETTTGAATSFNDVQPATVQIIARGTFRDPEIGFADASGAGSGFIISPDGLAVTNNHVVTGAATLEVFVGGDTTTSYNATIRGVSECNDLALIDITESEPLPYLDWYDGEIAPGLEVYAAGYPLGDPEFTLTRGIVSKARAGGDLTGTSSIDHTIEHDSNIQPGNSGGPLVNTDGQVVAVNYAGGAVATTTAQFFAIASDLAVPVVDRLRDGDFEALGINGWAVFDEAAGISGVWVAGVAAGSAAAQAEILPGDIVVTMNGLPIGTDGTFKDYCDVIRTAGSNPIAVEVLRYDTSEVLRGEINGSGPIELAFSFAEEIEDEVTVGEGGGPTDYSGYQSITDDTASIIVDVPFEWSDIDPTPIVNEDGSSTPYIAAATSIDGFFNDFVTSGMVFVELGPTADIAATLQEYGGGFAGSCTDLGVVDYSDAIFTGQYQVWDACAGTATANVVLVAVPADGAYTALMVVQLVNEADLAALDRLFATFNVIG